MSDTGLITVKSAHSAAQTLARLEALLKAKGVAVFARIDHAAGAKRAGMTLAPTTLVIFGDPHAGTPLMQADQSVGLDLPLKALVWQNEAGDSFVTYDDPRWIARRHGLTGAAAQAAEPLAATLETLVKAITAA